MSSGAGACTLRGMPGDETWADACTVMGGMTLGVWPAQASSEAAGRAVDGEAGTHGRARERQERAHGAKPDLKWQAKNSKKIELNL